MVMNKFRSVKLLIFVGVMVSIAFIQTTNQKRVVIKVKTDFFAVDNIGNIYAIKEGELVKYLNNGKLFAKYSNLKLGNIHSIDVTNPLKLLLYYKDFQQLVFLDNQLSVNSNDISLETLGYEQTELVCAGANNSFWIFDKQNNELLRFNQNSKLIASTGNLKQQLKAEITPNFMLEYNGFLYLNCPENGIYVFDIFGAFSKLIALRHLKEFQTNETIIYYHRDSVVCSYNYKLLEEACKPVKSFNQLSGIKLYNENIYKAYKDSLVVEKI